MEAEYIAGAEAVKDIVWLRSLLAELGLKQDGSTRLFMDNQAAMRLAGNPGTHTRSKHIEIKHHIIRERIESGDVDLEYIETTKQRADSFTSLSAVPRMQQQSKRSVLAPLRTTATVARMEIRMTTAARSSRGVTKRAHRLGR